ncbi:multidrug ABC transporter permease/ATP-binding protein [Moritella viscosa]|uniref:ABC export system,permease/ATP-binding protein n=1 Tax=Moritella viscosa TaxID=80854 RepID=A0A090IFT9_9GAMM|nr:multidrug ABC transporter permease/ATP-binding protein [Moritella viscosa]CED58659.1 ABC transporter, ATP-binding protein [Moritella viscosa]SGY82995.1 ABC export system,permease/ATP-binding protein [Moritella viscosa]SGY83382.1 ABC export system,permease/ATP-binding protein [Moritella viscosa]SGY83467.1 ABC export system,permease/ATP-binding protein [Moritella viscosa]SGY83944.1 ABC export system,permease/ATP-binding protein [Moritella viscosa]
MKLLMMLGAKQGSVLSAVMLLSLCSAGLSVGVIVFIQHNMLNPDGELVTLLVQFGMLLICLLLISTAAQVSLHILGHRFVYKKRYELVQQLLNTDIEQLEKIGGSSILASLNTDIRNITIAFVHLPELVYGAVLAIFAMIYLGFLSTSLFLVSLAMLSMTALIGYWLVYKISHYVQQVREYDDELFADYQAMIDGRKELALNPKRAQRFFYEEFDVHAKAYCEQVTKADIHNGFAGNLANTVILALIGLNYYLAVGLNWASLEVASTFALVILFMRSPLMSAVAALPALIAANVSMNKLTRLELNTDNLATESRNSYSGFKQLQFMGVEYTYQSETDESAFSVGPLNLTIEQGQLIFIIGGNGSGKSTFARLLTGLYRPQKGEVIIDGQPVSIASWHEYRTLFSAVFTDFHLFHQLLDAEGNNVESQRVEYWMNMLEMQHKVSYEDGKLSDVRYSQGQRKRLALLMAVLEQRDCLLLDEWAADQDPRFRHFFYQTILPLLKQRGKTIIAITHDDRYFNIADRVIKMDNGQLIELGDRELDQAQQVVEQVIS